MSPITLTVKEEKPNDRINRHRKSIRQNAVSIHDLKVERTKKLGLEGNFLHLIKGIFKNPTANITLNNERVDVFP